MAMNKTHAPVAQKSVLGMLIDDHREVQALFKEFKSAKGNAKKHEIVQHACMALTAHAEIEEKYFYPYLRDADSETFGDLLDEAKVEHGSAKDLIALLKKMKPGDDLYDARFTVLGEFTNHHIKEEEDEMFAKVISKDIDLRELAAPMLEAKEQSMAAQKMNRKS